MEKGCVQQFSFPGHWEGLVGCVQYRIGYINKETIKKLGVMTYVKRVYV